MPGLCIILLMMGIKYQNYNSWRKLSKILQKKTDNDTEPARKLDKHTLVKGDKKRNCVGCYAKLRTFLNSRQADKKVKKILTKCVQCKKNLCYPCFIEKH